MRDTRLPFTVLLPDEPDVPIEIHDHSVSLRLAVVMKNSIAHLSADWDGPGVYVLLDSLGADGSYGVYVGKAPAGVRSRLMEHERRRSWSKALLIQRDNQNGLNSSHVGWLEGDLYQLFDAAESANLHNANRPGDNTVPSYDIRILESFRDPITRVLRLIGYDPASADEVPALASSRRTKTRFEVRLDALIQAGILPGDVRLVSVNTAWPATAHLNIDGTILLEGQTYTSPSSAAAAVKGGTANGWDFWAVEGSAKSTRLSTYRRAYLDAAQGVQSNA